MKKVHYRNQLAIEICVDTVQSALAAEAGGAKRIELCNSLTEGGTTPSTGLIAVVRESVSIDVHVLIRPRRGDFLFSKLEFEAMKKDIAIAKQLGANGIVIGMLKRDGHIDIKKMQELIDCAYPLSITFHRAFDLTPDPIKSLDDLLHLKIDRLLTSGQQQTALLGVDLIRELVIKAGKEIIIMPGGGIDANNIQEIIRTTGAVEFHTSASHTVESAMIFRRNHIAMSNKSSLSEFEQRISDSAQIKAILKAVNDA